jgi:uncharacterized membrane-anchored protein
VRALRRFARRLATFVLQRDDGKRLREELQQHMAMKPDAKQRSSLGRLDRRRRATTTSKPSRASTR